MKLIHEYDFAGSHYGLVEFDDGSKVEIKHRDPLAKAAEMLSVGAFTPQGTPDPVRTILMSCSDRELVDECIGRHLNVVAAVGEV